MDRRKYRDNSEEFMLNYGLLGAILKQTYDDVKQLPDYLRQRRELKREDYKYRHRYTARKKRIDEEVSAGTDAVTFFRSERLENFIRTYRLDINPDYLRRKFNEIRREQCER